MHEAAPTTPTPIDLTDANALGTVHVPPAVNHLDVTHAHPRDSRIQFFDDGHIYDIDGRRDFVSCTSLVSRYYEPFDATAILKRMVAKDAVFPSDVTPDYVMRAGKYKGMTRQQIQQQWTANGKRASGLGTILHGCIEYALNGCLDRFPFPAPPEFVDHFPTFQREVLVNEGLTPYRSEWCVFDEVHELAGSIDMTFMTAAKDPDTLLIYDWKRTLKLGEKTNRYRNMCAPLDHLPDTNFWHYALQLNIYRHILETRYGKTIEGMVLVAFHPELPGTKGYQYEPVPFLREETIALFELRSEEIRRGLLN